MEEIILEKSVEACKKAKNGCPAQFVLAVTDTLNVMSGKWKLPIIGVLFFGKIRFSELEKKVGNITPRMLSKELKELELNGMVKRRVYNTIPVTIEYELTESGHSLHNVLDAMYEWGKKHRERVFKEEI